MKSIAVFFIGIFFCFYVHAQTGWQQVTNFGTNPGNLNMYIHVPVGISGDAPLVVVLHGCSQNAVKCRDNTGWNELSDIYKFYVMYPEQQVANNTYNCFNWFLPSDQNRDAGEALSIAQMVSTMKTNFTVDPARVYVTGLSAGAGMTAIMLACYPDVFDAGAIMAGVPYKAASDAMTASNAMYGLVNKTPQEWKDLVTGAYSSYSGDYPRVSVFHGLNDLVVYPANINELVEQWTAVHSVSQTAAATTLSFHGNADIEQAVYTNPASDTVVLTYRINNMGHAIAVDPGTGTEQGGTTGTYSIDKNFFSTYWAAKFFGIVNSPSSEINKNYFERKNFEVSQHLGSRKILIKTLSNNTNPIGITLFNSLGAQVLIKEFPGNFNPAEADISAVNAGIYFLKIEQKGSEMLVRKIVLR